MAGISSNPKTGYMYDQATDTWYAFGGNVNTAASYTWQASNTFESAVEFQDVVRAQAGVNNFQNPAARNAAIPTPTNGTVCFLRQDALGNIVNGIQYYYNGSWLFAGNVVSSKTITGNYTIQPSDAGSVIVTSGAASKTITVSSSSLPIGGRVEIFRTEGTVLVSASGTQILASGGYIADTSSITTIIRSSASTYLLAGNISQTP